MKRLIPLFAMWFVAIGCGYQAPQTMPDVPDTMPAPAPEPCPDCPPKPDKPEPKKPRVPRPWAPKPAASVDASECVAMAMAVQEIEVPREFNPAPGKEWNGWPPLRSDNLSEQDDRDLCSDEEYLYAYGDKKLLGIYVWSKEQYLPFDHAAKAWGQPTEPPFKVPEREAGAISLGGLTSPDGKQDVQIDLDISQRMSNISSQGAGMCVMTSIEQSARWAGLEQMRGLRDWCAKAEAGGADPGKVARQIPAFCKAKGIEVPAFVQYEGPDDTILREALASGRLVSATYSGSDSVRYKGPISHMICVSTYDASGWVSVSDNNGKLEELLWMSKEEFLKRWKDSRGGWAFVWLAAGPAPIPSAN